MSRETNYAGHLSPKQHKSIIKSPVSRNSGAIDDKTQYYLEDLANPFNEVHFYDENKQDLLNHLDNGMDFTPMMIQDGSP